MKEYGAYIGATFTMIMLVAAASGVLLWHLWQGIRRARRQAAEDVAATVEPFKTAAQGWESAARVKEIQVTQLEKKVAHLEVENAAKGEALARAERLVVTLSEQVRELQLRVAQLERA